MATEEKRIPLSIHPLATPAEVEGYLKSLVEEYKKIALDLPNICQEFPLCQYKMRVVGAITRSRAYFFFATDSRLSETTVKVEDTASEPKLAGVMDVLHPHYKEVALALGIHQVLFSASKEAIKGEFNYDKAKEHALGLIKEHYSLIENGQKFTPTSFDKIIPSKQIFVVNGHDNEMRETVARTLEKLELKPIILDEQSNKGLTIIEKLMTNSEVSFAVILLSPDDRGAEKNVHYKDQKFRARQNVIFELGFFLGKLKREQVFPLRRLEKGFESPSDFLGVVYTTYDTPTGNWRLELVRELQECGYSVDANKLTREPENDA
jgi:predicted nucleotide-binding protein